MPRFNEQVQIFQLGVSGGPVLTEGWPFTPEQEGVIYSVRTTAAAAANSRILNIGVFLGNVRDSLPAPDSSVDMTLGVGSRISIDGNIYTLEEEVVWRTPPDREPPIIVYDSRNRLDRGLLPDAGTIASPNGTVFDLAFNSGDNLVKTRNVPQEVLETLFLQDEDGNIPVEAYLEGFQGAGHPLGYATYQPGSILMELNTNQPLIPGLDPFISAGGTTKDGSEINHRLQEFHYDQRKGSFFSLGEELLTVDRYSSGSVLSSGVYTDLKLG